MRIREANGRAPVPRTSASRSRTTGSGLTVGAVEKDLSRDAHRDWRHSGLILFPRADAEDLLHGDDEDLAVSDIAGPGATHDRLHGGLDEVVRHADVEPHFLRQFHLHRGAAVGLDLIPLTAVAL